MFQKLAAIPHKQKNLFNPEAKAIFNVYYRDTPNLAVAG